MKHKFANVDVGTLCVVTPECWAYPHPGILDLEKMTRISVGRYFTFISPCIDSSFPGGEWIVGMMSDNMIFTIPGNRFKIVF